jgi:hypothetical protein
VADGRLRVRDRSVLRYYARGLDHLIGGRSRRTPLSISAASPRYQMARRLALMYDLSRSMF